MSAKSFVKLNKSEIVFVSGGGWGDLICGLTCGCLVSGYMRGREIYGEHALRLFEKKSEYFGDYALRMGRDMIANRQAQRDLIFLINTAKNALVITGIFIVTGLTFYAIGKGVEYILGIDDEK